MRTLTKAELGVCIAADAETRPVHPCGMGEAALRAGWGFPWTTRRISCRTRFCKWLTVDQASGGDVTVHTVAVIRTRKGDWHAKEVVRARVGGRTVSVRDMAFYNMSGYTVDWSPQGAGRRCEWNEGMRGGRWWRDPFNRNSNLWKVHCEVLNPSVLRQSPRFRYCAWLPECGDVLNYLKDYQENPRLEFLPKAGVPWLASSRGFVKRLAANKRFTQFVSRNLAEIKKENAYPNVIADAFKSGRTIQEAEAQSRTRLRFGRDFCRLIPGADFARMLDYVDRQKGATNWEYRQYIRLMIKEGRNLRDTAVMYPHDFHRASRLAKAREEAREWRANAAKRKAMERDLAARVAAFGGVAEMVDGGLLAHFPSSEKEFVREGKKLGHCVGSMGYAGKMSRGECVIVMVRHAARPTKPFVTAEIDAVTGKVRQCYGKHNSTPSDDVLAFVREKVAPAVKRAVKRVGRKAKRGAAA